MYSDAGWSSPVARLVHAQKVAGSNPAPATNLPGVVFVVIIYATNIAHDCAPCK